jgi:two-component system chemotaxis sensor kinase CheA
MPDSIDKLAKSSYSYYDMSLSEDDQQKYKSLYLQTARQYVKELHVNLLRAQSKKITADDLASLHRAAHSLKGQSEMMAYTKIGSLSALFEDLFFAVIGEKIVLTEVLIKKLLDSVEAMNFCLDEIENKNDEIDLSSNIDDLRAQIQI